jgi:hypothetical protein
MPFVGFEPTIPGFRASEDSSCLRPLGYRDRHLILCRLSVDRAITQTFRHWLTLEPRLQTRFPFVRFVTENVAPE